MLKRHHLFLCLFPLIFVPTEAQDLLKVDSLVIQISEQSSDSARSRIMFDIAMEIRTIDTVLALQYLESAKRISTDLNDTKGWGRYYSILGKMQAYHGQYRLAILNYDRALAYFSEADDHVSCFETVKDEIVQYLDGMNKQAEVEKYVTALRDLATIEFADSSLTR